MSGSPSPSAARADTSRQAQKERTREAILAAALELSQTQGFAQTSLRQVARQAGVVPTAFYRHFAAMDELGLALVEQSFGTLRAMIRDAQRDPNMVYRAEQVVQMPDGRPDLEEEIKRKARREMRLIVLGFEKWDSHSG